MSYPIRSLALAFQKSVTTVAGPQNSLVALQVNNLVTNDRPEEGLHAEPTWSHRSGLKASVSLVREWKCMQRCQTKFRFIVVCSDAGYFRTWRPSRHFIRLPCWPSHEIRFSRGFSETQESVLHKTRRASTTGRFHPTATVARFFVELWRSGLLHHWVQQNHDGLPQKVGHGSLACCPDKFWSALIVGASGHHLSDRSSSWYWQMKQIISVLVVPLLKDAIKCSRSLPSLNPRLQRV